MYTVRIFMECAHVCGQKSLLTLYQIMNKTCFPSLADEIAEPRPDMNITVAAFTVSEKSINTMIMEWFTIFGGKVHFTLSNIKRCRPITVCLCPIHETADIDGAWCTYRGDMMSVSMLTL